MHPPTVEKHNIYIMYKQLDGGEFYVIQVTPTDGGATIVKRKFSTGKALLEIDDPIQTLTKREARKLYRAWIKAGYKIFYGSVDELLAANYH